MTRTMRYKFVNMDFISSIESLYQCGKQLYMTSHAGMGIQFSISYEHIDNYTHIRLMIVSNISEAGYSLCRIYNNDNGCYIFESYINHS